MTGRNLTQMATSLQGLDDAARVDFVMRLNEEDRDAMGWLLLLQTSRDVQDLKRDRRRLTAVGHMAAALMGGLLGVLGQPLRP